jgi:hypothetical protein
MFLLRAQPLTDLQLGIESLSPRVVLPLCLVPIVFEGRGGVESGLGLLDEVRSALDDVGEFCRGVGEGVAGDGDGLVHLLSFSSRE